MAADQESPLPRFLDGGGEMGARVRAFDWASHPFGQPETWPLPLRMAVGLCLHSGFPTAVYWGPDLRLIYNDAWSAIPADRHPWALGRPAAEVWPDIWDVIGPQFDGVMATGNGFVAMDQHLAMERNGVPTETYWNYSFSPITDDDGVVHGILNQGNETTAKVLSERAHVAEAARFRELFEQSPNATALLAGPNHVFEFANPAYQTLVGRTDLVGRRVADALPEVVAQGYVDVLDRVYAEGVPFRAAATPVMLLRDGAAAPEERLLDFVFQPTRDAAGIVTGIYIGAVDSTDRARAETASRASEARLQLALDAAGNIGTWEWDVRADSLVGDGRMARLFGIDATELQGASAAAYLSAVHPDDLPRVTEAMGAAFAAAGPVATDYRLVLPDGSIRWLALRGECRNGADGRPERFTGVTIDISDVKQAEIALRSAKEEREFVLALTERQRQQSDPDDVMQITAEAIGQRLGVDRAGFFRVIDDSIIDYGACWTAGAMPPLTGQMPAAIFGPRVREVIRAGRTLAFGEPAAPHGPTEEALAATQTQAGICVPLLRDGVWAAGFYVSHATPRAWTAQELALAEEVAELCWDAVARTQAVATLRSMNVSLSGQVADRDRIWDVSQDMLGIALQDGTWLNVNPAWTQMLGWAPADVIGKTSAWLIHPEDLPRAQAENAGRTEGKGSVNFELRFRCKTGEYRTLSWNAVLTGGRIYATAQDVTERRELEERLRQSQKMEAVGQLTGGLAHDFNNLLTGISGAMEMLQVRLNQGRLTDLGRYITAAQTASGRAAALTHRLLAFSRRQTLDPKPIDVNRLIGGIEELIRRTVGPEVRVEVVGAAGLWPTLVDPNQLENALLNLCINARDAMDGRGRLTIETANKWLDERAAGDRDLPPGQYVSLCVTDTGTGMSPEIIERVFEPFFTTKPQGQGTGLGLSMIYGFARQSGGQVRIYSEVGEGTTMCLYLPRHYGAAEGVEPTTREIRIARPASGQTVLVVDDEPTVRMLVTEVLEELGLTGIEAADGAGALTVLRSDARLDLLITDVGLPGGMNGRQVADAARAARPELPILFITGYAENAVIGNGQLEPGIELMTKPFSMDALGQRIRTMVGEDDGA